MPHFALRRAIVALPLAVALLAGCSKSNGGKTGNTVLAVDDDSPSASDSAERAPTGAAVALSDATVQLPAVPGRPAVAYFTLTAAPGASGKLASVDVAHFARSEMHQSKMEGGAMTMSPVYNLPIVPGKAIVFAPAGLHVMLFNADTGIKPGDTADLTATLSDGTKITTKAKVTSQGGM